MKKVNALVLGLVVLLVLGCGKEDEPAPVATEANTSSRNCQLTKSTSHVYGYEYDYVYNAAGQVIKATRTSQLAYLSNYDLVTYNNLGLVEKVSKYNLANELVEYRLYEYTADSLVKKDTKYTQPSPADTTFVPLSYNEYTYDAAKRLTQVKYFPANQPGAPSGITTFTHRPDGSIFEENFAPNLGGITDSREYIFASGKAPVRQVAYFDLWEALKAPSAGILFNKLPAAITQINYSNGTVFQTSTFQYTYTLNADGYPLVQEMGYPGQQPLINTWTYNCQ